MYQKAIFDNVYSWILLPACLLIFTDYQVKLFNFYIREVFLRRKQKLTATYFIKKQWQLRFSLKMYVVLMPLAQYVYHWINMVFSMTEVHFTFNKILSK